MSDMLTFEGVEGFIVDFHQDERKFSCCICKSFIMIPPVLLNPAKGFICGFCWQHREKFIKNNDIVLPQTLYEELAASIRFPCRNCELFTCFDTPAATHEIQCSKRIFPCPLSKAYNWFLPAIKGCDWQDKDGISMVQHVKEHHKDFVLNSPFEINLKDIKCNRTNQQLYIAILSNRKIVSIIVEYNEEKSRIFFRCRSNKTGRPGLNYQCRIGLKSPDFNEEQPFKVRVFPLGSKILEGIDDYCTLWVDGLNENSVFRFYFEPSCIDPGQLCYYDAENEYNYYY